MDRHSSPVNVEEQGPIAKLLYYLCDLYLDSFITDTISDPALLLRLLIAKNGIKSHKSYHLNVLRRLRNKLVHKAPLSTDEFSSWIDSVVYVQEWLAGDTFTSNKQEIQSACLTICDELQASADTTTTDRKLISRQTNSKEQSPLRVQLRSDSTNNLIGTLGDLKNKSRELLKGKTIKILDGNFQGQTAKFCGWNGSNVKVMLNAEIKYLPLSRKVEVLLE